VSLLRLGAGVVALLPWVRAIGALPAWVAGLVDTAFLSLCHHLPGRVLSVGGEAMCVCSRCAGLYGGLALGFVVASPRLADATYRRIVMLAAALTALDVVTQDLGLHAPSHPVRLATGALLGWAVAAWMVEASRGRAVALALSRR
jgi:uncharacterized membrane protein